MTAEPFNTVSLQPMHFLALDIGSSFIKGAVLDAEKLTIEHITRVPFPEPIARLPPGYFEIEPRLVVDAVKEVVASLLEKTPHCHNILFASQMGGVILTKPYSAEPLTNYISWRDQRTTGTHPFTQGSYLGAVRKHLGPERIGKLGNELRAGSALAILFWLEEQGQLPAGANPLALGDFVVASLVGGGSRTEQTLALGLVDLQNGWDWCWEAFKTLGLDKLDWMILPENRTIIQDLYAHREECGVWHFAGCRLTCFPPIGDHQAAVAGALLQHRELSINISTGSQISMLSNEIPSGDYQTRPYFEGANLNTITDLPAGRSLDVLVHLVDKPWPEIVKAAEAAPDTDLAANLAFFEGPLGSRGSISNITTENLSVGTLFRAAFRNMADNYATCAARLSPEKSWDRIVFSGGLAQKLPLLREFILEKLPGESRLCSSAEDTLLGLLVISQVISGRAKDLKEASRLVSAAQGG
jgi:sugar (pentulose or hexulose) kinase